MMRTILSRRRIPALMLSLLLPAVRAADRLGVCTRIVPPIASLSAPASAPSPPPTPAHDPPWANRTPSRCQPLRMRPSGADTAAANETTALLRYVDQLTAFQQSQ